MRFTANGIDLDAALKGWAKVRNWDDYLERQRRIDSLAHRHLWNVCSLPLKKLTCEYGIEIGEQNNASFTVLGFRKTGAAWHVIFCVF